jgi:hypothetical protein
VVLGGTVLWTDTHNDHEDAWDEKTTNGGNFRRAESARSWTILRAFFFVGRSWKGERRERSDSPARHRGPTEGVTFRVHRRHTSRGSRFDSTTKILSHTSGRCETLFLSTDRHLPGRNMYVVAASPPLPPALSHLSPDRSSASTIHVTPRLRVRPRTQTVGPIISSSPKKRIFPFVSE